MDEALEAIHNQSPIHRIEDFASLVRKSGLLTEDQLQGSISYIQNNPEEGQPPLKQLIAHLLERNLLTRWQIDELLRGNTEDFYLGTYVLLDQIGETRSSRVFLAEHVFMRRYVAVKVLPPNFAEDESRVRRFFKESRAIASLDHPNIVQAFHFDEHQGRYYLVTEYVSGEDLQRKVQRSGPLPFREAAEYIAQAAEGLSHAHKRHLIHRDIKPANLLVDKEGCLKILDLGMVRYTGLDHSTTTEHGRQEGSDSGGIHFFAPEQLRDFHRVDHRCDLYALGCTLYYLLAGKPPFAATSLPEMIECHLHRAPPELSSLRAGLPPLLEAICRKLMAKAPADRYESAEEVGKVLREWIKRGCPAEAPDLEPEFHEQLLKAITDSAEPSESIELTESSPESEAADESAEPESQEVQEVEVQEDSELEGSEIDDSELDDSDLDDSELDDSELDDSEPEGVVETSSDIQAEEDAAEEIEQTPSGIGDAELTDAELADSEISEDEAESDEERNRLQHQIRKLRDVLTLQEVAEFLRIDAVHVESLARDGKIPGIQIDDHWRFHRRSIEQWLQQTNFNSNTWISVRAPEPRIRLQETLGDLVERLRVSNLFDEAEWQRVLSIARRLASSDPNALVTALRDQRVLSDYQIERVREGRIAELRLGDFLLCDRLSHSDTSEVFSARHHQTRKPVVIKVLTAPEESSSPAESNRFEREVRAVSKLQHPHLVSVLQTVCNQLETYVVMEALTGETLGERIQRSGPLPFVEAARLTLQIAEALEYAHGKHVVHRDLNPSNLVFEDQEHVKVLNLGLASLQITQGTKAAKSARAYFDQLTAEEVSYLAPEVIMAPQQSDNRADIYSLGCIFYLMLTGRPLFEHDSTMLLLEAHLNQPLPDLRESLPEAPVSTVLILRKMLAKEPRFRYQSMRGIIEELQEQLPEDELAAETPSEIGSTEITPPLKRFRPTRLLTLISMGLLVVLMLAFVIYVGLTPE